MLIHLIDGTYELFRHFYGRRRSDEGRDRPLGAVAGVLHSVLELIEQGGTHIGVATDHVIESFRNELWPAYKTGDGIEPALLAQFHPLEDALAAMGITVWPMIDLEADDALAAAAYRAAEEPRVERVCIWANDKDLAQCVRGARIVQVIRRDMQVRDAEAVRAKFGVPPNLIPDYLALVGDAQDGYPGIRGIGRVTAARLLNRHGPIEENAIRHYERFLELWSDPDPELREMVELAERRLSRLRGRGLGERDSAVAHLEAAITPSIGINWQVSSRVMWPFVLRRLGELEESRGNTEAALRHYRRWLELRSDPDPSLRGEVAAVRRAVARLAGAETS